MEDPLGWLPAGWVMEIKIRKGGAKPGTPYKCYIAPITGCKFYSKQEVFRYLKTGKVDPEAPQPKRRALNMRFAENVVSRIEKSPDGLPPGWIKEIKFRKKSLGHGFRKDPYYTDPVTGCIFRSKRDVLHYLETGNLGPHVHTPKTMCVKANNSTNTNLSSPVSASKQKSARNLVRRRLFKSHNLMANGVAADQINGLKQEEQCGQDFKSRSLGNTKKHSKIRGKRGQGSKCSSVDENLLTSCSTIGQEETSKIENHDSKHSEPVAHAMDTQDTQENVVLSEARSGNRLCNGEPHDLRVNHRAEGKMLLKLSDSIPSENMGLTKSEENHVSGTVNQMILLERDLLTNGATLKSPAGKQSKNEVASESGDNQCIEKGVMLEIQDTKPSVNGGLVISENTEPLENQMQLQLKAKNLSGRQVEQKCNATRTRLHSNKAKSEKATLLPRRASKRLAGLEAEAALDISCPERGRLAAKHSVASQTAGFTSRGSAAQTSELLEKLTASCAPEGTKVSEDPTEKPIMEKPVADEKSDSLFAPPFGDTWLDPCLEFAFKTLTSDIPDNLDTIAIEDYFQQQLGVGQSQTQNMDCNDLLQSELLDHPMAGKHIAEPKGDGGGLEKKGECR